MTTIHPPLGSQQIETAGQLDEQVLEGATIYLNVAGPVPISELVRVLAQHLDTSHLGLVDASVRRLVAAGRLAAAGWQISMPAGVGSRDTEGA